ncbi:hypothetical protein MRB53_038574 [Persea americana]|nr:hypothetical protein MRB53_038574 [Persea americana]
MSELSTVAIKDGHRGHLGHHHTQAPSGLSNQLDAERADRISRLAGLERVTTARNPTPIGNLTPGVAAPANPPQGYFDAQGNPTIGRERSTVGSASATGSVGAHTTWAGSESGDMDKMSESQDMDMDTSSVGGMSDEAGSLVAFGEGARTPARQSTISVPGAKAATPTARDTRMTDGADTVPHTAAAEQAAQIVRDNMDTTSNDRISERQPGALGRLPFEK